MLNYWTHLLGEQDLFGHIRFWFSLLSAQVFQKFCIWRDLLDSIQQRKVYFNLLEKIYHFIDCCALFTKGRRCVKTSRKGGFGHVRGYYSRNRWRRRVDLLFLGTFHPRTLRILVWLSSIFLRLFRPSLNLTPIPQRDNYFVLLMVSFMSLGATTHFKGILRVDSGLAR